MKNIEVKKLEIETNMPGLTTNTYIAYDIKSKEAFVIDPAEDAKLISDVINENKLELKYIIYTHCHADHIAAIKELKKIYPDSKILGSKIESENINNSHITQESGFEIKLGEFTTDIKVEEDDEIILGKTKFRIILTPGHTSGSMSIYSEEEKIVFTGDTLFVRGYGRTDLPTGDIYELYVSLRKLLDLPVETKVYPGHGNGGKIADCK